jgi:protein-tyrosine phosphatase
MFRSIVIVCTANICRSPMGQGLLAALQPGLEVSSAGLHAVDGLPPDPVAVAMLHEQGIEIAGHRSRRLSIATVAQADLILTMEQAQKLYIERRYRQAHGKVFAMAKADIADPYRRSLDDYARAVGQLTKATQFWAERISLLRRAP